jgi:hypothetical protein
MKNVLLDQKTIKVATTRGLEEWCYELRDRGTNFAMRRVTIDGVANIGEVHVGKEAHVRQMWKRADEKAAK